MKITEEKVMLKNGKEITLRSPEAKDAKTSIDCMNEIFAEAKYLSAYPEEFNVSLEDEINFIEGFLYNEKGFFIGAFDEETMIGNLSISKKDKKHKKVAHRATLGIAVKEEYCSGGLGTAMFKKALTTAKENGFEQIELSVHSENERAQNLYKKMGFKEVGRIPYGIKDKNGNYMDQIIMVLRF